MRARWVSTETVNNLRHIVPLIISAVYFSPLFNFHWDRVATHSWRNRWEDLSLSRVQLRLREGYPGVGAGGWGDNVDIKEGTI